MRLSVYEKGMLTFELDSDAAPGIEPPYAETYERVKKGEGDA